MILINDQQHIQFTHTWTVIAVVGQRRNGRAVDCRQRRPHTYILKSAFELISPRSIPNCGSHRRKAGVCWLVSDGYKKETMHTWSADPEETKLIQERMEAAALDPYYNENARRSPLIYKVIISYEKKNKQTWVDLPAVTYFTFEDNGFTTRHRTHA